MPEKGQQRYCLHHFTGGACVMCHYNPHKEKKVLPQKKSDDDMELESVAQAIDEAGFNVAAVRVRQAMREIETLKRETGFARLAYDQLIERRAQEKERFIGLLCQKIEAEAQKGYSESTVAHFRSIVVAAARAND
jgi:predicted TIM-barrel fold metal-dependent hydrolase